MQKTLVQPIHTLVNGRARFKVGGLYDSERMKKHLESRLSNHDRIKGFSVSILTGNILIFYNSTSTHYAVATFIEGVVIEYKKKNGNHQFEIRDQKKRKGRFLTPDRRRLGASALDVRKIKNLRKCIVDTEDLMIEP